MNSERKKPIFALIISGILFTSFILSISDAVLLLSEEVHPVLGENHIQQLQAFGWVYWGFGKVLLIATSVSFFRLHRYSLFFSKVILLSYCAAVAWAFYKLSDIVVHDKLTFAWLAMWDTGFVYTFPFILIMCGYAAFLKHRGILS